MAWRPHGRAHVNYPAMTAYGRCDRCDLIYNLKDLVWQYDYRGNNLTNIRLRVCTLTCLDTPYQGRRPIKLPADPLPVRDPRPINPLPQEENASEPVTLGWDEPGILWDDGNDRYTP